MGLDFVVEKWKFLLYCRIDWIRFRVLWTELSKFMQLVLEGELVGNWDLLFWTLEAFKLFNLWLGLLTMCFSAALPGLLGEGLRLVWKMGFWKKSKTLI